MGLDLCTYHWEDVIQWFAEEEEEGGETELGEMERGHREKDKGVEGDTHFSNLGEAQLQVWSLEEEHEVDKVVVLEEPQEEGQPSSASCWLVRKRQDLLVASVFWLDTRDSKETEEVFKK